MITTNRNQYLAAHTTKEVKAALRHEAAKADPIRPSVSETVHKILADALRARGYAIPEEKTT